MVGAHLLGDVVEERCTEDWQRSMRPEVYRAMLPALFPTQRIERALLKMRFLSDLLPLVTFWKMPPVKENLLRSDGMSCEAI